jgi:hypothetical protein
MIAQPQTGHLTQLVTVQCLHIASSSAQPRPLRTDVPALRQYCLCPISKPNDVHNQLQLILLQLQILQRRCFDLLTTEWALNVHSPDVAFQHLVHIQLYFALLQLKLLPYPPGAPLH